MNTDIYEANLRAQLFTLMVEFNARDAFPTNKHMKLECMVLNECIEAIESELQSLNKGTDALEQTANDINTLSVAKEQGQ